jgi:DNA transposition AAA+ family ATPase
MSDPINIAPLREKARDVENYRLENDWTVAKLRAEIFGLPNNKTYARLLDDTDDGADLDLEKLLHQYTDAADRVATRRKAEKLAEPEYKDFTNITDTLAALRMALREDGIHRLIAVDGENGTGKDAGIHAILREYPNNAFYTQANELMRESLAAFTEEMLLALYELETKGAATQPLVLPRYPLERQRLVIDKLSKRKFIWIINDAHRLGVRALNTIITIIDQTKVIPVLFFIPTLFRNLASDNYEEVKQLFGNRLCQSVSLPKPQAGEILELWERRGVKITNRELAEMCAVSVQHEAPAFGNWTYVKLLTRDLVDASKRASINDVKFSELHGAFKLRRHRNSKVASLLKAKS